MQFSVPKSIDMPDKVIGPLSIKQFIFLAGGGGFAYLIFQIVPGYIFSVILAAPFLLFGIALAFFKINGQSFLKIIQALFLFLKNAKFYIWYNDSEKKLKKMQDEKTQKNKQENYEIPASKITDNKKIQDIAWALDVLDKKSGQ